MVNSMDIKEVKNEIKNDRKVYLGKKYLIYLILKHQNYIYYKALKYNRLYRFYKLHRKRLFSKIKFIYIIKMKNLYCNKYSLELNGANIGKNFRIYHSNIVINEKSVIGDNCCLHGNNCIGNNGINNNCPVIGNNVDIGYGVTIIGNVRIVDNVIIGANSVIVKDLTEENAIYAGCPAKLIRKTINDD
jgi:epsO